MARKSTVLGLNEALILAGLISGQESTIAEIAERVKDDRDLDDGTIYVALRRMEARRYVTVRRADAESADGRIREIGHYKITGAGSSAVDEFARAAQGVHRLRLATGRA